MEKNTSIVQTVVPICRFTCLGKTEESNSVMASGLPEGFVWSANYKENHLHLLKESIMKKDFSQLGYVGSLNTVDRNEWYTPLKYIKAARRVLGDIEFDPFSDELANQVVQANEYRGKNDPRKWKEVKTVWMNPPYGRGLIESAIEEFFIELQTQHFEAIVLVNNATETKWFQQLLAKMDAVCLTHHRIAFTSEDGKSVSGNTRGQAFFYFGVDSALFDHEFRQFGMILKKH